VPLAIAEIAVETEAAVPSTFAMIETEAAVLNEVPAVSVKPRPLYSALNSGLHAIFEKIIHISPHYPPWDFA